MLKENLLVKYQELNNDFSFDYFTLMARVGDEVYYTYDGVGVSQDRLVDFQRVDFDCNVATDIFRDTEANVIAFFSTENTQKASNLGGMPTILDDFTEIFGSKIKAIDKGYKKILSALKRKRAVFVKENYVIIRARSLDEAGTMIRIIDKNSFVLSKCPSFVKINPIVAKGMNIGFTYFYSKRNQERIWGEENTKPIPKNRKVNVGEIADIYNDDKRVEALKIAQKLYADNFTQGTWGNVSVRIDDNTLYCTPKAISYNLLTPDDIVLMDYNKVEQLSVGNRATSEKGIHCRIMREHKDCYVAVHAHPTYSSIYCAMNKTLEVSPENRAILGERVCCSKHAIPMSKRLANNSVDAMTGGKAGFMGNHGVAIYGDSIEDVFRVITALEYEAKLGIEKLTANKPD